MILKSSLGNEAEFKVYLYLIRTQNFTLWEEKISP